MSRFSGWEDERSPFTKRTEREIQKAIDMQHRGMELLALVAAEFESDPMSVQCFDLRIVEEIKNIAKEYPKLRSKAFI